ncbi:GntR family transcriptional regulator [Sphingobium sp. LMA1-1-1.1]|uniref:GntR family transcriptional regulator n=1 Tax=unclassified Sphingobium TaxID=2611147 RepID=UPI0034361CA8
MKAAQADGSGVPSHIAAQVRALVARGILAPGMRLGQTELAERFQASRVPVREALKLLSSEGIVEHDPNRGFFVTPLSRDEAEQLFVMRHLIEDELLTSVAWPDEAQLKELDERAHELEGLLDAGNRTEWWEQHREFHRMIFNLSPRKIIVREAMRLWMLTDRYRVLLPLPRRVSEERDIVNKHSLVAALAEQNRPKLINERRARRQGFERLVIEMLASRDL